MKTFGQGNISVNIEELILDGFAPADRYRIADAAQRELGRLLAETGPPWAAGAAIDLSRIDAGAIEIPAGAGADAIGIRIGRAVYEGMPR